MGGEKCAFLFACFKLAKAKGLKLECNGTARVDYLSICLSSVFFSPFSLCAKYKEAQGTNIKNSLAILPRHHF